MKVLHSSAELRAELSRYQRPALVATMGNLHEGHLALVQQAKALGDVNVATIFVNRLQFLPHEDFSTYPRTLESDCAKLHSAGCDLVFAPSEQELYPTAQTYKIHPPAELADILEGHFRPGFFVGVCTVVLKLFNIVQPRVALFGKKDYQQQLILRHMIAQMALPIELVTGDTRRADDGLALSSRNSYLSATQRRQAVELSQELKRMVEALRKADYRFNELEAQAMQSLLGHGWQPDYMTVRRRDNLQSPQPGDDLVVLGAARLGNTRLIDNFEV